MKIKTGNQGHLRKQNLAGVLQHLYDNAPISRIELARLTGLNKATVTNLVNELIKNNLVYEAGEATDKRAGRREVLLEVNPNRGCFLSAEIGVGFISIICTNFRAEIIWQHRESFENLEPRYLLAQTNQLLKKGKTTGEEKCGELLGIAVSIPGLITQKTGEVLFAPNLGWRNVEVLTAIKSEFDVPIYIDNEATFAALGEKLFGVAKGYNDVLYISAGVGIGGGLIINGQIYNGASGFASEFGHITMSPSGEKCACGNIGCWETQASQSVLFREIENAIQEGRETSLQKVKVDKKLSVPVIIDAAETGDQLAIQAFEKIGAFLGVGIDSLVKIFNPELVVFGGILSTADKFILPAIISEVRKRTLLEDNTTPIVRAKFGADAAVMGGVGKALQAFLVNPLG